MSSMSVSVEGGMCGCRVRRAREWLPGLRAIVRICPIMILSVLAPRLVDLTLHIGMSLTNDRLYESKDSREMLKGSFSSYAHRLTEDDVVDRDDAVPQKDLRSEVGEGGR